jgi:hypothetical protein
MADGDEYTASNWGLGGPPCNTAVSYATQPLERRASKSNPEWLVAELTTIFIVAAVLASSVAILVLPVE